MWHVLFLDQLPVISNSMEQSPFWTANQFSVSRAFSCTVWNPKADHHVFKSLLFVPVLSQINPFCAPLSILFV